MSRVMIALGSPRKQGNTACLVEAVADGAREAGADVEVLDVAHMSISPCASCFACEKSDKYECVIDDAMKPLYARLVETDALALATPVYWLGPAAQIKIFWDRLYGCVKFDAEAGKFVSGMKGGAKFAGIITAGGDPFDGADVIAAMLRRSAVALEMEYAGTMLATGCGGPEKLREDAAQMEKARAFGRSLV